LSVDFQVAFPQELVRINTVRTLPGLPIRTLDIIGEDFRSLNEVLMNEVPVPAGGVVVLSRNRLLAEVPDILKDQSITSISVTSSRLTITDRSFIRFRIGTVPSKARGIIRLIQLFLKILFQTPGTDIFAPKVGGGALKSLGENYGKEEGADIQASFIIAVDNTARQIIQIQGRDASTPPDERLLTANVLSIGFNLNETALVASIEVTSQAGVRAVPRLEL
jgi:hypothetical protein